MRSPGSKNQYIDDFVLLATVFDEMVRDQVWGLHVRSYLRCGRVAQI